MEIPKPKPKPKDIELLEIKEIWKEEEDMIDGEISPLSPITYTVPPPSPRIYKVNLINDILELIRYVYNK